MFSGYATALYMNRIGLYWKNATAGAVGEEHGVSERELDELTAPIRELTAQMAADRKAGKLRFRDLPRDREMRAEPPRHHRSQGGNTARDRDQGRLSHAGSA